MAIVIQILFTWKRETFSGKQNNGFRLVDAGGIYMIHSRADTLYEVTNPVTIASFTHISPDPRHFTLRV